MSRTQPDPRPEALVPDALLEAFEKDVDRTLLRENLRRSPDERFENLMALQRFFEEARRVRALRTQ